MTKKPLDLKREVPAIVIVQVFLTNSCMAVIRDEELRRWADKDLQVSHFCCLLFAKYITNQLILQSCNFTITGNKIYIYIYIQSAIKRKTIQLILTDPFADIVIKVPERGESLQRGSGVQLLVEQLCFC